jgi:PadR family transcriptional regulator, regulatory protein PadR
LHCKVLCDTMKPMNENQGLITQMRKGAIEYCILALLAGRERYGYELVQAFSLVDGMLVTEGTVYPILSRLKRDGLVATEWRESREGPPRKYYRLTPNGIRALDEFRAQWQVFARAVDTILEGGSDL